jgi:outer membrane protein insertion porin family
MFGCLLALPWIASAALAQPAAAPFVGKPVASYVITIEGTPSDDAALKGAITTKVGAPLAMADVRETITHLYSFGRFEDVQVAADLTRDRRVTLRYDLQPIHIVTRVDFTGSLGLPEGMLRSRMIERFGANPALSRANDVALALRDLYHERGYLSASVRPGEPILQHEPHRATEVFVVDSGPLTKIAKATVAGHPLESIDSVRARLQIEPGQPYEPGELQKRLSNYVVWMRRQRHYEAGAHEEPPSFPADKSTADVTVNVEPGPVVRVEYEGDPLPTTKKIEDLVPIEREGSVDPDILEDSAQRIKDALNQQGYWKADVQPPEQREANGELVIVFHIKRGAQYRVASGGIEVDGNTSVPVAELQPLLKMAPGELYVDSRLTAIENTIKLLYLQKGFVQVTISSQTNEGGPGLAKPVIVVKEGTRVTIGQVKIAGNAHVPTDDLMKKVTVKTGAPYYLPSILDSRDQIRDEYQNRGYASVDVTAAPLSATPNGPATATSDVVFNVAEGPQTIVEHVFVSGNLKTKPDVILRQLRFKAGAPLGADELTESRRRLAALGLFRRIQISTVSHGDPSRSDVVVTVEEAPRTTIGYGGGLQVDRILRSNEDNTATSEVYEFAPRGFFEIGRRNLAGSNRSVDLYTRVSLRPTTTSDNNAQFTEYRVVGTYREPQAFGTSADLTGTAAVEQAVRTGFNFARQGVNAELSRRLTAKIRGVFRYSLSTTRVFDLDPSLADVDQNLINRAFPQVRISAVSLAVSRDTRDDLLEPQRGFFLSADGTLAARALGGEVGYAKTYLQGFMYKNLGKPRLVFAGGARLGLADPFPRPCETTDPNNPDQVIAGTCDFLPESERFFAGGDTTIRGYAVDTVGTPDTITSTGVPIGGNAVIILNAELRTPIAGPVGGVFFIDGGNVFNRTSDLDLTNLIGSIGTGVRVKSPVGPIRFDIGFKLNRRVIGGVLEPGYAIHFSIGQAF